MPELLDEAQIRAELSTLARSQLARIEIHQSIDSTNSYLLSRAQHGLPGGTVCLAEEQTAGKGRRGRHFVSPFAANLYCSLLWRFRLPPQRLQCLSLASGIAAVRALQTLDIHSAGLKWPNDILWQDRKLGGILVELSRAAQDDYFAVVGIGINVNMPAHISIDQPWIDLAGIIGPDHTSLSRNRLAAALLNELVDILNAFETTDSQLIIQQWQRFDMLKDRPVSVKLNDKAFSGTARGISSDGALLLETENGIQRYSAGEVSLRALR